MPMHRPPAPARTPRFAPTVSLASASVVALALAMGAVAPARAQLGAPPAVVPAGAAGQGTPLSFTAGRRDGNMLVNADQLVYDDRANAVTARGRVQLFYDGRTVEADEVTYDRGANRLRARGNVRIAERGGNVAYAEDLEFDEEFKNGFVRSLNIETPDRRRVGALTATRESGETTVFQGTTYTACEPCRTDPQRPPTWRVRSMRIVHKESERNIYFENSRLEFFGLPVAYLPYFWAPDGRDSKRSGFLMPAFTFSSRTGVGLEIPYFWNIAPNYDLLIAPVVYSRQGVMPRFEYRHGFETGSFVVRGAGINQLDRSAFSGEQGDRLWRGYLQSVGEFRLSPQWRLGWDVTLLSDSTFLRDYALLAPNQFEANSRIYLRGQGDRSWFDLSATRYVGITASDITNRQQPLTHPQLDYFKTLGNSVLGGELSWRVNVASLTRERADLLARRPTDWTTGAGSTSMFACTGDPTMLPTALAGPPGRRINNPADCILNGFDGTYTRASAEASWRRRIIDQVGQIWEPYFALRGDLAWSSLRDTSLIAGTFTRLSGNGETIVRVMPTAALTYRYPFVAASTAGTTTIEPIAQFIVRPSETSIGRLPNEDAQSLVFDDTNLFGYSRFSGWDRIEGGGRLNYGLNIGHRFTNGGYLSVLFGQSLHLFGLNSYTFGDPTIVGRPFDVASVGVNSGLDKPRSDFVARVNYVHDANFRVSARARFDERTFAIQRAEFEATTRFGAFAATGTFAYIAAQPLLGYQVARSGMTAALSYRVTDNWTVYGAVRYAFQRQNPDATVVDPTQWTQRNRVEGFTVGLSYLDECFQFGFFYSRDFAAATGIATAARDVDRFMLRFNMRTLGDVSITQNASNLPSAVANPTP